MPTCCCQCGDASTGVALYLRTLRPKEDYERLQRPHPDYRALILNCNERKYMYSDHLRPVFIILSLWL